MTEVVNSKEFKNVSTPKHIHSNNPFENLEFWIELINNNFRNTWKAGKNFHSTLPSNYIYALVGTKPPTDHIPSIKVLHPIGAVNEFLPKYFDARDKWNYCQSLHKVRDQGECGSCWAVASTSVLADRLCISSEGKFQTQLSIEEPLSCCKTCGEGCEGGYVDKVWDYIFKNGVVTGGDFNSSEGCLPYSKEPCEHSVQSIGRVKCSELPMNTPRCRTFCSNRDYNIPFGKDHKKAREVYKLPQLMLTIQSDIYKRGPIQAVFEVYEDFLAYKKGIYQRTTHKHNKFIGYHSVKVIGWGVEEQVPYWLAVNSWNNDWGDYGTFKILRGKNECGFESQLYAGLPEITEAEA
ncbi:cathepsin B-like cysteine proteinase 4 [Lycorma delicatula]|uniref:cathepsin B-like cysteine proteinase 4 n=1 Tax=Lycorma delicatula TaxID=130591 RepID=UPI003F510F6C